MAVGARKPMRWCLLGLLVALGCPSIARAQATGQIWSNVIADWLATDRLAYQIDVEPKAQVVRAADQPAWLDLDVTPHVEYALAPWVDMLGEVDIARKAESNEINTTTVSPRVGAELHILSRILQTRGSRGAEREKLPKRRTTVSTLLRLEHQAQWSTGSAASTSSWQIRDRFNVAYPLNRPKTSVDGAVYLTSDCELFMPIDQTSNRLVNELRFRTGFGYRRSFAQRFEALYVWTGERNGSSGPIAAQTHAIDIRIKLAF